MDGGTVVALFIGFAIFALLIRLMAGGLDRDRVDRYIEERGGRVLDKQWTPFGRGWFGEKDSRIYSVRYQDAQGNVHDATCKTSMLSGVYFTEDKIVQRAEGGGDRDAQALADENRRLREEVERLKSQRG